MVVETESSVAAVFTGSGTEDGTPKSVEATAPVVAVIMLTSVIDAPPPNIKCPFWNVNCSFLPMIPF